MAATEVGGAGDILVGWGLPVLGGGGPSAVAPLEGGGPDDRLVGGAFEGGW